MKSISMYLALALLLPGTALQAQNKGAQLREDGYTVVEKAAPTPFTPATENISKSCVSNRITGDVESAMAGKIDELRKNKATEVEGQISGDRYVIFFTVKKKSELGETKYFSSDVMSDAQQAHEYFQSNLQKVRDMDGVILEGLLYGKFFENGMRYVHTINYAFKSVNIYPSVSERCEVY